MLLDVPAPTGPGKIPLDIPDGTPHGIALRIVAAVVQINVILRTLREKKPEPVEPSALVSMAVAARILGISREALKKRLQRHQLPPGCTQFVPGTSRVQFVRANLVQPAKRR